MQIRTDPTYALITSIVYVRKQPDTSVSIFGGVQLAPSINAGVVKYLSILKRIALDCPESGRIPSCVRVHGTDRGDSQRSCIGIDVVGRNV